MENLQNYSDYRKKYHHLSPFFPPFLKKKGNLKSFSNNFHFFGFKVIWLCGFTEVCKG